MSNDPLRISLDKLTELLRGLGLDPADLKYLKSLHMEGGTIEVVRYRHDEAGQLVVLAHNEVAAETVTIGIGGDRPRRTDTDLYPVEVHHKQPDAKAIVDAVKKHVRLGRA